ncbi:hypothetical protein HAX54_048651 [Datura stramonium]|uniref:Uncharacterized protein n=1 Tax=Datura stramonium TaxID=4076 RepID=A0ABS8WLX6_DATST|nr:hypothetical protein [Datura stramonium]
MMSMAGGSTQWARVAHFALPTPFLPREYSKNRRLAEIEETQSPGYIKATTLRWFSKGFRKGVTAQSEGGAFPSFIVTGVKRDRGGYLAGVVSVVCHEVPMDKGTSESSLFSAWLKKHRVNQCDHDIVGACDGADANPRLHIYGKRKRLTQNRSLAGRLVPARYALPVGCSFIRLFHPGARLCVEKNLRLRSLFATHFRSYFGIDVLLESWNPIYGNGHDGGSPREPNRGHVPHAIPVAPGETAWSIKSQPHEWSPV